ncbi:MAG: MBL fold metallo-hydrolase RNA specificity domain-containing protein [Promethearchaeota archaeon]
MHVRILGGINEIGGNKILFSHGDKNILFDYGLSFTQNNIFFSNYLKPRKLNGIVDYLYLNLIPPVKNIYRTDYIEPFQKVVDSYYSRNGAIEVSKIDAFFLSHPHMDHYKFMGFLKKSTPIYLSWEANMVIRYIDSVNQNDYITSELLEYHDLFKKVPKKRQKKDAAQKEYKRATRNDYTPEETKRPIKFFETGKRIEFRSDQGPFSITPHKVDHSVIGAFGFIIEHDGRSLIYTGDFRLHGLHPEWVESFVEQIKKSNPVAVITEGTNVPSKLVSDNEGSNEIESEKGVKNFAKSIIRSHPGLIFVNIPGRNLDRICTFYKLAEKSHRVFVIPAKIYRFLEMCWNEINNFEDETKKEQFLEAYPIPSLDSEYLKVFLPRKGWGKFESEDYRAYEKEIFKQGNYITYKDIKADQAHYLMYINFYMMNDIIDIDPDRKTAIYINSQTEPFNEELRLQEEKLNAWMDRFGILKTEKIHSSGHCSVNDLIRILNQIEPDKIIPIHTEHPETFKNMGLNSKILLPDSFKFGDKIII